MSDESEIVKELREQENSGENLLIRCFSWGFNAECY